MSDDFRPERLGPEREHGPEWWAMDREYMCDYCGHTAYDHFERMGDGDPAPCKVCSCGDFADDPA